MKVYINKNIFPLLTVMVFFIATLFSTRQLINHTNMLHEQYFKNRTTAEDMGRAFNDFEAVFLSYMAGNRQQGTKVIEKKIRHVEKMYKRFYSTVEANHLDSRFIAHARSLENDLLVLERLFKNTDGNPSIAIDDVAINALYQMHITLSNLGYDLIIDHNTAFNGGDMNKHRFVLYLSVFMMAISGIILVLMLISKISRLEIAGNDKKTAMEMLEDRMAAIELARDGIAIAEQDGTLSFANRAFTEMYGYTTWFSMIGQKWIDLCGEDMRNILRHDVLPVVSTGGSWSGTGDGIRRDGSVFRKSVSISALPGQRWILVVQDVSDKIKTEELSMQRLAAIEAAGDGIGITDAGGNLIYMNRALKLLHEFDEHEAQERIGAPWADLYTPLGQEQIVQTVMPALQKDGYWKGESPILTSTGRTIFAELSLTLLPNGGMTGTARDITERMRAAQEKAELEKKLFQAQKMEAVGRLAGGIAHDFNNILAAIMGYAEFLLEDLPKDKPEYKYAKSIHDGGAQARDVIDRLLTFSRTHDHKMEIMELRAKVDEAISLMRPTIPSTTRIDLYIAGSPMLISGNKTLISQAIMNLCVNAIDAIEGNHGVITVETRQQIYVKMPDYMVLGNLVEGSNYYVLSIADDGCGMSMETMERIFDPFFTTKDIDKGTGLGLSSVHGIMASHNGAVAVRSKPGEGTEFLLFFPVNEEALLMAPFENAVFHPSIVPQSNNHVLVVDDQDEVRVMMVEMLQRLGYQTKSQSCGMAAIEDVAGNPQDYALVLLDQTMPGITGCELAEKMAQRVPSLPVILMSGFSAENLSELAADIPSIYGILHKPVSRDELNKAVAQALAGRRLAA